MTRFLDHYVHGKWLVGQGEELILTDDITCEWRDWRITVKRGFTTDGASIPRLFWRVIGHPFGDYLAAAIVHDALYASEVWPRKTADNVFRDLLAALNIGTVRRNLMYAAVRTGGAAAWPHSDDSKADAAKYLEIEPL